MTNPFQNPAEKDGDDGGTRGVPWTALATLLAVLWTWPAAAQQPSGDGSKDAGGPLAECDEYMEAYLHSASRKLYRALSGHDFELREISLQPWLDLEVTKNGRTRAVSFTVLREKDDRVAALIDSERSYRQTLVVADTASGPLVTSQLWPTREAVQNGRMECRPIESQIHAPDPPLSRIVDVDPFKFWGLRVLWRLPASFRPGSEKSSGRSLYRAIVDTIDAS